MAEETKEEKEAREKADQDYKDKKKSCDDFAKKHQFRIDKLADMAVDIKKRGINHELGVKGEIADKLVYLKDLEAKRNANPLIAQKDKYKIIIEELEKELL